VHGLGFNEDLMGRSYGLGPGYGDHAGWDAGDGERGGEFGTTGADRQGARKEQTIGKWPDMHPAEAETYRMLTTGAMSAQAMVKVRAVLVCPERRGMRPRVFGRRSADAKTGRRRSCWGTLRGTSTAQTSRRACSPSLCAPHARVSRAPRRLACAAPSHAFTRAAPQVSVHFLRYFFIPLLSPLLTLFHYYVIGRPHGAAPAAPAANVTSGI
jgi:hypothetical protein